MKNRHRSQLLLAAALLAASAPALAADAPEQALTERVEQISREINAAINERMSAELELRLAGQTKAQTPRWTEHLNAGPLNAGIAVGAQGGSVLLGR